MCRFFFFSMFLFVSSVVMGQKWSSTCMVYGHVADLITRTPIDSAWVFLMDKELNVIDSVQSVRKNMNGRDGGYMFSDRRPKGSEFILKVTHSDYYTLTLPIKLKTTDPLPVIYLKRTPPKPTWELDLPEVAVTATKLKFFYKGDTLVYDASAFKLPEGSMLDDLIRQLPGAELRENGEILVNGRKVDQLLLQGKRLFDSNRQLILENLPYFTVKNIKVFETEGSALDPLSKLYVMDVNLKKEYMDGTIANAEVGGGTDQRFMARAFVLGMTEFSVASAYINTNNLNDVAKPGERGNWNPQSAGDGIPKNILAGIRYETKSKDNTVRADGSVDFSHTSKDVETTSLRENYLTGGNTFQNSFHTTHNRNLSFNTRHHVNLNGVTGCISRMSFSPVLTYHKFDNKSRYISALFNENVTSALGKEWIDSIASPQAGGLLFSKSINRLMTKDKRTGHSLYTELEFDPELGFLSDMRTYTFFNYSYSNSASKDFEHYNLDFPSQTSSVPVFKNNYMDRGNETHSLRGQIRKSIQSKKGLFLDKYGWDLMPRYEYSATWGNSHDRKYLLHQLEDWDETAELGMLPSMAELLTVQDNANSSWQKTVNQKHTVGAYVYFSDVKDKNLSLYLDLPVNGYVNRLDYNRMAFSTRVDRHWWFFEPHLNLKYKEHRRNYELNYNGRASIYSLVNMIPLSDTSDPLNIFTGNPDLSAGYQHSLSLNLRSDLSGQRAYNVGMSYAVSTNSLAMGYVYDRTTGIKNITPQNVDGNWNANIHGDYNCPLDKAHRLTLGSSASAAYFNSVDMIGVAGSDATRMVTTKSTVGTLYANAMLRMDYRLMDKHTFGVKGNLHYTHSGSEREDFVSVNAYDFDYSLVANIELPYNFRLSTDITMYSRRGYSDESMNTNDLIWNARLTKRFMKGRLLLMADGFDILGNLSNIRRTINAQGRTETYYNVISNYVMFHIQYTFTNFKK